MFLWWRMVSPDIALQWTALPVRYAVNLFFFLQSICVSPYGETYCPKDQS